MKKRLQYIDKGLIPKHTNTGFSRENKKGKYLINKYWNSFIKLYYFLNLWILWKVKPRTATL